MTGFYLKYSPELKWLIRLSELREVKGFFNQFFSFLFEINHIDSKRVSQMTTN